MRKRIRELEGQLMDALEERGLAVSQTDILKEELQRQERNRDRAENANLEYLKNIVLAYITSKDAAGRHSMLKAIAAVLRFDKREQKAARAAEQAGGWLW